VGQTSAPFGNVASVASWASAVIGVQIMIASGGPMDTTSAAVGQLLDERFQFGIRHARWQIDENPVSANSLGYTGSMAS
jgi:hypothetical protein